MKRKPPSELIEDCNWEKALEWTGNQNVESSNLNLEEIEEVILGIFKSNVARNSGNFSSSHEDKEKTQHADEEKKTKVFETIKEPKNFYKKKSNKVYLQNQEKKGNTSINNTGANFNNFNNNLLNMNMMNQFGLTDPNLQMIFGNNMIPNGMNMNIGNLMPNIGMNNLNTQTGWDQMTNGMNFNFQGAIPSSVKKEDNLNKNNLVDNNLLNYLLTSNLNCMDLSNEEMLRNLMKANNGLNMNNMMGGYCNSNSNNCNGVYNDPQNIDNIAILNELINSLLNSSGNMRGMMPINEMMMQMCGANQSVDSLNNKNTGSAGMNTSNVKIDSNTFLNNLIGFPNIPFVQNLIKDEKKGDEISSNLINPILNSSRGVNPSNQKTNVNSHDIIPDNLADVSKIQSFQQLANALKMFSGNTSRISPTANELISNLPEIYNSNLMGGLFNSTDNLHAPRNINILENNANQMGTSNSYETNKEIDYNAKRDPAENTSSLIPSKPTDNLPSDDLSIMLLNLLNSSNPPQLPLGYDLNSFSQLFELQNLNNLAAHNNNFKKQNDSSQNIEPVSEAKEREIEESNQNKTHISANHNINNNMQFNPNVNVFGNNNPLGSNNIGGNFDFNINPNIFQQQNINQFIGDPILGFVNQFLSQPNNLMPNSNASNLPIFNSKSQIDNYYLNNFNHMDLYFDPNMMNQNNFNSANNKNYSEK